jgi:hypothetical protein
MPVLTPTEYEMLHWAGQVYDPVQAHKYYEEHKKLKGRHRGSTQQPTSRRSAAPLQSTKTKQKAELQARITSLSRKLQQLEDLIQKKEEALKRDKSTAKKERAAKEKDKPKTAAEKAKAARDAKQYRKKHHQELKTKAKQASSKSGGGSSSKKETTKPKDMHIADLKALATKVRGQIAVAKQKLAAL